MCRELVVLRVEVSFAICQLRYGLIHNSKTEVTGHCSHWALNNYVLYVLWFERSPFHVNALFSHKRLNANPRRLYFAAKVVCNQMKYITDKPFYMELLTNRQKSYNEVGP